MLEVWNDLTSEEQLEEIDLQSKSKPVAIFKHSTRCGISSRAEYQLEQGWGWGKEDFTFYHLDLIRYRNVSNAIADKYQVHHQSPQLIWIVDGKAVDSKTHHAIEPSVIQHWIQKG